MISKLIIESLIVCAFEGGSNYWYRIESDTKKDYLKTVFEDGLTVSNHHVQDEDKPREGVLNQASIDKALEIMHDKYPRHYGDILQENEDAITGDVFLQCALFGEVIYG